LRENFDRFNFAIHKEKEMVSFRRLVTALAVLAVFAGLAGAQTQILQCQTNVAVTPTLRAEGFTEQTGDITLICAGGANQALGSQVPQINITLFYNTAVTSRLLPITNVSNTVSEALLLLDDPGSGVASYYGSGGAGSSNPGKFFGTNANQILCSTPLTGCAAVVSSVTPTDGPFAGTPVAAATPSAQGVTASTPAANIYQGVVSGNTITFFGVPVLAPVTSGASRTIRITNARVNATQLGGGSAAGATPVIASISISGATSLLISNATPTVGFVQGGLTATASGATNLNQCNSQTRTAVNVLTFSENFPTAFKTRIFAQQNTSFAGQSVPGNGVPSQNIPGSIYNSESNFVFPGAASGSQIAGLADFGTRLKATFNSVPAGVRIFVSLQNVLNAANLQTSNPNPLGGNAGNVNPPGPAALLVAGETTTDGNASSGFFPAAPGSGDTVGNVPLAELAVVNGTASAVWEVVNTNPNANESLKFAAYVTYVSNVAQNSPPPGTATVNLSFAPSPPAFSASSGAAASSTLTIPRFIADPNAAKNIFNINICRTILLYPYVTNIAGFDTGLAIANTSTDPFGTGAQAGSCKLNWYQGANNPAVADTGTIASGTVYTTLASTAVPGFNGYMIAVCNFQFAHGFAFVSDLGARNLAMGYLALIIPDPTTIGGNRSASPACEGLGNGSSCIASGENIAH
jgi:hypothetical protein